jgi:hypothetical protein
MTLGGIGEGLVTEAAWNVGKAGIMSLLTGKITITSPRFQEVLQYPAPLGDRLSYRMDGTLRHLPQDHAIWLLHAEDEGAGRARVWPQGFEAVQYDPVTRRWSGRVSIASSSGSFVRLVAVVAPPTSRDFFSYFQRNGGKTGYDGLLRIPPECHNRTSVQAKVP